MTITNPTQLVDEFKKSGEFDRLRRELLNQFQRSDRIAGVTARVEDITRQRLESDQKLLLKPHDALHRDLLQEVERYPIVERAIMGDMQTLTDPAFASAIRAAAERILADDRAKAPPPSPMHTITADPRTRPGDHLNPSEAQIADGGPKFSSDPVSTKTDAPDLSEGAAASTLKFIPQPVGAGPSHPKSGAQSPLPTTTLPGPES